MADTIVNGKEYLLYVNAGAAPTDPDEITNYTKVGLLRSISFSDTSERLVSNNKDNGARTTTLPGNQTANITGSVEWAHDVNTGQEIVWDAVKATTASSKILGWLITTNVTSDIQLRGTGNALSWELDLSNNEISAADFEIGVDGDYTKEAVD